MEMKKLFQNLLILLIISGFNGVLASTTQLQYDPFLNISGHLKGLLSFYGVRLDNYFEQRGENDCVVLYIKQLLEEVDKGNIFFDPLALKSDFCSDFVLYAQVRQCKGLLHDFELFFGKEFLEKVYKDKNKQLQIFLDNIFTLFFLFPQKDTCENVICKHKMCTKRNDLNIYKAYGAIRTYVSLYLVGIKNKESSQSKKRMKEIMRRLVPFIQSVLTSDEKYSLRMYIDQIANDFINEISSNKKVTYSRDDITKLKEMLQSEIFAAIPQEERNIQMKINELRKDIEKLNALQIEEDQKSEFKKDIENKIEKLEKKLDDMREKRINPTKPIYQRYFKQLKGFFKQRSR